MKTYLKNLLQSLGLVTVVVVSPYLFGDEEFTAKGTLSISNMSKWLFVCVLLSLLFTLFDKVWKKYTGR